MDSSIVSSHENYPPHIDSDDYHYQNETWLGFSLFQPFPQSVMNGGEQDGESADLSMLTLGSPKLEDFLGGGCDDSGTQIVFAPSNKTRKIDKSSSSSPTFARPGSPEESQKQLVVAKPQDQPSSKKAIESFGQRTSVYRGVTRHRWTGRYEAHLWDNSCRREGQSRKGRQVYLGGYDKEDRAARAYDLAALKYWGPTTTTNFPASSYEKELEEMKNMTRQEFVASLRRKSSGFSRGASMYRGVTRHHQHGRWQARIGRVAGNKDLYLGTFSTQEEAAEAYDIAAIKFRGVNAVTNFDMSRYDVNSIATNNLPVGGATTKSKTKASSSILSGSLKNASRNQSNQPEHCDLSMSSSSSITFGLQPVKQDSSDYWPMIAYNQQSYNSTGTDGLYQQSTSFSMEFSSTMMNDNINSDVGYFSTGGGGSCINNLQQSSVDGGASSSISFATPMDLNMNNLQQQSCVDGGSSSSISFATPVDLNSNINSDTPTCYGMSTGNLSNWNVSFQSARASNPSMYQSPIFGME
ncbi:AP2-like ethylene-responsive transcription factor AIL5 [Apium graveolens]|uniref:AP2-like ethylene-responsive transcription factor AIL5 n=1 Tax=Apium graveolens TaxID=4045 RepID=UPI003D7A79DB